ncbi:LPS translocon maturation chaperone LptM [Extensimonas sp. H3M7-6]|uniref:LPS translocon maturation chaperone LptM n=1 Tax=Extensimonas soli TaxID=3031322 RepID=UPI0023DB3EF7|nr:lipoprotein [Extensimonas sp. H3M7-6]MDF1480531.1 lipoprotein [Extensimonas sp. H3M7-6]
MRNVRKILPSLWALTALATLMGCGQRGPLYLPQEPAARERATLPQVLTPESLANKPAAPAAAQAPASIPASAPASPSKPANVPASAPDSGAR